jgi:hypothetical protein
VICVWPGAGQAAAEVTVRLQLSQRWAFSSLVPRPDACEVAECGPSGGGVSTPGVGGRFAEWRVTAQADGTLLHGGSGGRAYSYLFWEALTTGGAAPRERCGSPPPPAVVCEEPGPLAPAPAGEAAAPRSAIPDSPESTAGREGWLAATPAELPLPDFVPERSFCVAGCEAEAWLYAALQAFGLPTRETTDFLTYCESPAGFVWLLCVPRLQKDSCCLCAAS